MWGWLAVGVMMAGTAVAQEAEPPQLNVMLITVDNLRPANMSEIQPRFCRPSQTGRSSSKTPGRRRRGPLRE
jgi:hypothetical protein